MTPRFDRATWVCAVLLVAIVWLARLLAGPYEVARGRVTVNDREDCGFAIGQHAYLSLHPGGIDCVRMREFVGKSIQLFAVVEE